MREIFKKTAEENRAVLNQGLGEFLEGTWALARKSSDLIDSYRREIPADGKELKATLMLRNSISDLCCCLDSLERGHCRTLTNNLRMVFEDYCCVLQLQFDSRAYSLFIKGDFEVSKAVTLAKKQHREQKDFSGLSNRFSEQPLLSILARQITSTENDVATYAHLKPIHAHQLTAQMDNLSFIASILIEIVVLAEKICQNLTGSLYFGTKTPEGYLKRLDTPEVLFSSKLAEQARLCL